ncbi:unnamed protein product [Chrysoparadoxa australica]
MMGELERNRKEEEEDQEVDTEGAKETDLMSVRSEEMAGLTTIARRLALAQTQQTQAQATWWVMDENPPGQAGATAGDGSGEQEGGGASRRPSIERRPEPLEGDYLSSEVARQMLSPYKSHVKHRFADDNGRGSVGCKFLCHTFWASQFKALRLVYLRGEGESEEDVEEGYAHSLGDASKWDAKGGKSGATFSKTADERFVVKYITRTELQMFLDSATSYFEYMARAYFHNLPTVLCKILGVYQIGFHNRVTGKKFMEPVVVMQNLFCGRRITRVFDLKGSARSRYVTVIPDQEESAAADGAGYMDVATSNQADKQVLLDGNLMELTGGQPLPLNEHSKAAFQTAILNDTLFLSIINIVDYSIVVGLDEDHHTLVVGIIDFMRQYDIMKRVERMGKSVSMIAGQAEPTIVQPSLYRSRFQMAMDRYFVSVPNKWSCSTVFQSDGGGNNQPAS